MNRPGKTVKVVGNQVTPVMNLMGQNIAGQSRPARLNYAQKTNDVPNTTMEKSIEKVFIPFYDRPGYTTDNAAMEYNDGRMFVLPDVPNMMVSD